jgi:hypothetical protein
MVPELVAKHILIYRRRIMDDGLIAEIWDTFKEYIPEKSRETAANHFVDFLVANDVELTTLESLMGYDNHLDQAIELVLNEFKEDDDDDTEDNWDSNAAEED